MISVGLISKDTDWGIQIQGALPHDYKTHLYEISSSLNIRSADVWVIKVSQLNAQDLEDLKNFQPAVCVLVGDASEQAGMEALSFKTAIRIYETSGAAVLSAVKKALEAHDSITHATFLSPVLTQTNAVKLDSRSEEMSRVFGIIQRVSEVDTPVLLRGESGTGKEVMAKAIHFNSKRRNGRFVAINCSAIPETLIEADLFGHEKGAFTGAVQKKLGKFQYADGGTLFLDEIGDVTPAVQVKLLRVLQDHKITPIGSNHEVDVNVRIIAATHRNLEEMLKSGELREDFFYRISVLPIFLPPLRNRLEDLDELILHYVHKFSQEHKKSLGSIDPHAMQILMNYKWPGNIRELRNVIEHAVVFENSPVITPRSLPARLIQAEVSTTQPTPSFIQVGAELDFQEQKEMFEREFLLKALKKYKGKINQTSLHTKIPKKTLLRKLEKYKIVASAYKD